MNIPGDVRLLRALDEGGSESTVRQRVRALRGKRAALHSDSITVRDHIDDPRSLLALPAGVAASFPHPAVLAARRVARTAAFEARISRSSLRFAAAERAHRLAEALRTARAPASAEVVATLTRVESLTPSRLAALDAPVALAAASVDTTAARRMTADLDALRSLKLDEAAVDREIASLETAITRLGRLGWGTRDGARALVARFVSKANRRRLATYVLPLVIGGGISLLPLLLLPLFTQKNAKRQPQAAPPGPSTSQP